MDLSITLLSQAGLACIIRLQLIPSPAGGGLNDVNSLNPEPQAYLAASLRLPKVTRQLSLHSFLESR